MGRGEQDESSPPIAGIEENDPVDPLRQRLAEECDKYGLPHSLDILLRHIYNNHCNAERDALLQ